MGRKPKNLTSQTVAEAAEDFLAYAQARLPQSPGTLQNKRSIITRAVRALGPDRAVWLLTPGDLDRAVTAMTAQYRSTKAAANVRTNVRQFAEFCRRNRWLAPDVRLEAEIITPLPVTSGTPGAVAPGFDPHEWPTVLSAAGRRHFRLRMSVALGLYLGRRASEILAVQWKHIDHTAQEVTFWNKKARRWATVPYPDEFAAELGLWRRSAARRAGIPQGEWYLVPRLLTMERARAAGGEFVTRDPETWPMDFFRPMGYASLQMHTRRLLADLGYPPGTTTGTHTWRRSAARAVETEIGLPAAQALLDHRDPRTTLGYTGNRGGLAALRAAWAPDGRPQVSTLRAAGAPAPPDTARLSERG